MSDRCQQDIASSSRVAADIERLASQDGQRPVDRTVTTCPRSRFHEAATWCAQRVAVGLNALAGRSLGRGFGIFGYHRVADRPPSVESPTVNVTPRQFRHQLQGLLARGFEAWPLRTVLDACRASRPIPSNVFVVTFDDGYENNLLYALPVLKELRVPATIFLATAYLDSQRPFPFDNWSCAGSSSVAATSWRPLSTAQCKELLESELIELGVHTHTHGAFAENVDEFRRDLSTSIELVRQRFGISQPTFSFPFGLTTSEMIVAARESGVACALNTRSERVDPNSDAFLWGRFNASDLDTPATLAAKLNGWYTPVAKLLREIKRPVAAIAPRAIGELVALSEPCNAGGQIGATQSEVPTPIEA